MTILPFDLLLTVGTAIAVFMLGVTVWWRRKRAIGNVLYSLVAISLATWTATDWILHLLGADPNTPQRLAWKLFFYATVCLTPAFVVHASSHLARRAFQGMRRIVYVLSVLAFLCMALAFLAPVLPSVPFPIDAANTLTVGAVFTLFLYAGALVFVSFDLYPLMTFASQSLLMRRRATYGLVLLVPVLMAGGMQMVAGPFPVGFFLPIFAASFLIVSLLAFIRASFLDVELGPLEAFFLLLITFATISFLRSQSAAEQISVAIGSIAVGAFALLAIRTVNVERHRRRVAEEASRQLHMLERARKDFVDMVAHQLRGPLGGIRGSASMLSSGDYGSLPPKARDAADLIEGAATRLLSLADSFLNASRIEVGRYESRHIETDVRKITEHILSELRSVADAKGLQLKTEFDSHVPARILLDQEVLENALFNLVDNAVKYSERGTIRISGRVNGGICVLEVRDSGMGMSEKDLSELFRKFQRGDSAHAKDGTGLGLYIVKELVEAAGGTVRAESAGIGHGSAFTVTLPCSRVDTGKT